MGILRDAIGGAAATGKELTLEAIKADILAKRDASLEKNRAKERAADRTFRTSERLAGQTFTAGRDDAKAVEAGKRDASRAKISAATDASRKESAAETAKIRYAEQTSGLEIIASQGIFNHDTQTLEPFPTSPKERSRQALKMAEIMVANGQNVDDKDNELTVEQVRNRVYKTLKAESDAEQALIRENASSGPEKAADPVSGEAIFTSSKKYGSQPVTEANISAMMKRYGKSRKFVVDRLKGN